MLERPARKTRFRLVAMRLSVVMIAAIGLGGAASQPAAAQQKPPTIPSHAVKPPTAVAPAGKESESLQKAKFGDWELRCDAPPGAAKEQCALLQSVAADDRPNINLVVITLKTADGKSRLLRVIAPLGILLPNGLGLKVDEADVGRAGFVRCLPTGCVAEVIMDDKLLEMLRNGKIATFIIYQTPEEGIGIPLSLAGFGQGFDALP